MNKEERTLSAEELALWCRQFDHHNPGLNHDNVYQIYEHLRENCPVTSSEQYGGFRVVSRYADIVTALMDPTTFCSSQGVHIPRQEGQMKVIPIDFDPPLHTRYRRIFTEALLSTYPPFRLDGKVIWSHMEGGHHMGVRSLPVTFL